MKLFGRKRLTAAIAAAMVLATALPSYAWTPTLSLSQVRISGCSWNYKAGTTGETGVVPYIRVGGNPWSAATVAPDNGARQNFASLAQEGVGRWNGITQNSPNYRIGMTYSTSTTGADIRLYQGLPAAEQKAGFAGYTYIQRVGDSNAGVNRCLEQAPNSSFNPSDIRQVNIYNRVSDVWFTQYGNDQWNRDVRKEWEKCFDARETPDPRLAAYTCKKTIDFGSVITHELGHAIGMVHPDPEQNRSSAPAAAARCGYVKEQATMCREIYRGRTAQRTPEIPDHDAYAWGETYK